MNMINNIDSFLGYFLPESSLILGILLLILRAMFSKTSEHEDAWPMRIALVCLSVSLYFVVKVSSPEIKSLFSGLMAFDPLSSFFKVIILVTGLVISVFADTSLDLKKSPKPEFYAFLLTLCLGLLTMTAANDLLMIYLSIEMASIVSYILTGFLSNNPRSDEAGLKYVFFGGLASGIMIFGLSLLYGLTGTLNLIEIREALLSQALNPEGWAVLYVTFIMILAGLGYKMAIAPFHMWSPDVYEGAPMPISAFLSVASKAAGFALTLRFFLVGFVVATPTGWETLKGIDWQNLISILAMITMTIGNLAALKQTNIKRFLAYSSVAHAGYLLIGLASKSGQGIEAILMYFVLYLIMNLGAFLVAIFVAQEWNTENMEDYKGLSRQGGYGFLLSVCMTIFLLSLAGLPPFAGFIGKLYIFGAAIKSGLYLLAVVGVLNSVISLYYYVKLMKLLFFYEPKETQVLSTSLWRYVVVVPVFAFLTLLFGLYFSPLTHWVKSSAYLLY